MIKLIGKQLYQWDTGRQVEVAEAIDEVHFGCCVSKDALIVKVSDGVANIPNIMLQRTLDIKVWGVICSDDCTLTVFETTLAVTSRTKPSDYVYTEIEIKNYDNLEKRIELLEKGGASEEQIAQAVEDYLRENNISADVYMRVSDGYVQYSSDNEAWNNVIALSELKGKDGKDGVDGRDGIDGKTPIKGTDYFTQADKNELVTDVLNALPQWQGGAY